MKQETIDGVSFSWQWTETGLLVCFTDVPAWHGDGVSSGTFVLLPRGSEGIGADYLESRTGWADTRGTHRNGAVADFLSGLLSPVVIRGTDGELQGHEAQEACEPWPSQSTVMAWLQDRWEQEPIEGCDRHAAFWRLWSHMQDPLTLDRWAAPWVAEVVGSMEDLTALRGDPQHYIEWAYAELSAEPVAEEA